MTAKPLAEAYEKLKELRRQADSGDELRSFLQDLNPTHDQVAPQRDAEAIRAAAKDTPPLPEGLIRTIRTIATKTLADRIFGDPVKADAWLMRPSAKLSGQRPVDLLQDELGTAVVREMLEQIDHGIFA